MSIIHDIKQPGNIDVATVTDSTQQASNSESIYRAGAILVGYQTDVLPRVGECKRSVYESTRIFMTSLGLKTRSNNNTKKFKFDQSRLPSPESFWALHGIRLKLKKGWVMAKCVFHNDQHASLGVDTESGGFFCHACGAKGGDVLTAHQLITGLTFVASAKALGAWEIN